MGVNPTEKWVRRQGHPRIVFLGTDDIRQFVRASGLWLLLLLMRLNFFVGFAIALTVLLVVDAYALETQRRPH